MNARCNIFFKNAQKELNEQNETKWCNGFLVVQRQSHSRWDSSFPTWHRNKASFELSNPNLSPGKLAVLATHEDSTYKQAKQWHPHAETILWLHLALPAQWSEYILKPTWLLPILSKRSKHDCVVRGPFLKSHQNGDYLLHCLLLIFFPFMKGCRGKIVFLQTKWSGSTAECVQKFEDGREIRGGAWPFWK